jgi:hypothetical protein
VQHPKDTASLTLDYDSQSLFSGAGQVVAFSTWRFQYWHRDGMNPSRFSKGISGLIN